MPVAFVAFTIDFTLRSSLFPLLTFCFRITPRILHSTHAICLHSLLWLTPKPQNFCDDFLDFEEQWSGILYDGLYLDSRMFFFLHRLELLILENTVELKGPFLCCIRHILNISFPWNFHCEPYFLLPIFDFLGSEVRILSILNVEESFNLHFLGRGIICIYYFEFSKEDIPLFTLI